jgi:putative ABC transport system permease protein
MAIAVGFAAVNLFGGFAEYMNESIRLVTIYAAGQGHMMIFRQGFLEKGRIDPARYLLTAKEVQTIRVVCAEHPMVKLATPQLGITGLLTNGNESTIFVAQGIVPSDRQVFFEYLRALLLAKVKTTVAGPEGKMLADDQEQGVAVSRGLAALLQLKLGDSAVAFSSTVNGQMNALDVEVFQLFNVSSEQLNDKVMIVPFSLAQKLYDTDGADRVAVLLARTEQTRSVRDQLSRVLKERGVNVQIRTWDEMSEWYRKVKDMFDTIFQLLFIIVLAIVVMSVVNTMSMAVLERTREIGTLRALGLKRRGVLSLFTIESGLLGVFGSLMGTILTLISWGLVKVLQPTWVPPGVPRAVIINIELIPEKMAWSFLFIVILCLFTSLIPARRAARHNIVDALGHV